jgi:hypothetical protein
VYRPVPRVPDFPSMEGALPAFWAGRHIFEKQRAQTAGGPRWSFLDGPITANSIARPKRQLGQRVETMYPVGPSTDEDQITQPGAHGREQAGESLPVLHVTAPLRARGGAPSFG